MRAQGLGLGGSLDNAVVMDEYRVLNSDGLRYEDEFVKHKVLDAIGDLYLLGHPVIGAFSAHKSGPCAEQQAGARAAGDKPAWEFVSFERQKRRPRSSACRRSTPEPQRHVRSPRGVPASDAAGSSHHDCCRTARRRVSSC